MNVWIAYECKGKKSKEFYNDVKQGLKGHYSKMFGYPVPDEAVIITLNESYLTTNCCKSQKLNLKYDGLEDLVNKVNFPDNVGVAKMGKAKNEKYQLHTIKLMPNGKHQFNGEELYNTLIQHLH